MVSVSDRRSGIKFLVLLAMAAFGNVTLFSSRRKDASSEDSNVVATMHLKATNKDSSGSHHNEQSSSSLPNGNEHHDFEDNNNLVQLERKEEVKEFIVEDQVGTLEKEPSSSVKETNQDIDLPNEKVVDDEDRPPPVPVVTADKVEEEKPAMIASVDNRQQTPSQGLQEEESLVETKADETKKETLEQKAETVVEDEQIQQQTEVKEPSSVVVPPPTASDDDDDDDDDAAALESVLARRQAYDDEGDLDRWSFRGLGYMYTHKGMVLKASLPSYTNLQPGRNVVEIHDVATAQDRQQSKSKSNRTPRPLVGNECELLIMWVRVKGPEIFAGKTEAVRTSSSEDDDEPCHWEFAFDLSVPGDYQIDVKLLLWNPHTTVKSYYNASNLPEGKKVTGVVAGMQCPWEEGGPKNVSASTAMQENHPFHEGIMGFKLYDPVRACCEVCSRQAPHCKHWATPPDHHEPNRMRNGCELYYKETDNMIPASKLLPNRTSVISTSTELPDVTSDATTTTTSTTQRLRQRRRRRLSDVPHYHGDPHSNPTTYFLGCGWSFSYTLDYPCLSGNLDDRVFVVQRNFTFSTEQARTEKETTSAAQVATQQQAPPLPLCTLDHETLDSHDGRWVRQPFPNSTVCPNAMTVDPDFKSRFEIIKFDATHPHCWHRDDFSKIGKSCIEMNCRLIPKTSKWISDLHEETQWYGVWKPYACDYLEFTNEQLQTCITQRNISKIETKGASIAQYLGEYVKQRLVNMKMHEGDDGEEGRSVVLSTMTLLHKMGVPDNGQAAKLLNDKKPLKPLNPDTEEVYWLSGFFLSSERCPHCHMSRMHMMNHMTNETILPLGYQMINAFDMSAAFTYDTATQFDGMHIIGPTMKMAITKLFHHMCKDTVSGSRVGSIVS